MDMCNVMAWALVLVVLRFSHGYQGDKGGVQKLVYFGENTRTYRIQLYSSNVADMVYANGRRFLSVGFDPICQELIISTEGSVVKINLFSPATKGYQEDTIDNDYQINLVMAYQKETVVNEYYTNIAVDWLSRFLFAKSDNGITMLGLDNIVPVRTIDVPVREFAVDIFNSFIFVLDEVCNCVKRFGYYGNEWEVVFEAKTQEWITCFNVDWRLGEFYFFEDKSSVLYKQRADKSREVITRTNKDRRIHKIYRDGASVVSLEYGGYLPDQVKLISTTTEGQPVTVYNSSSTVTDFTLAYNQTVTQSEMCLDEFAKCLGINNNYQCLKRSMICDGVSDCMAQLDEFYCCYGNAMCGTKTIELTCNPATNNINSSFVSTFVDWQRHPFSKILDDSSFSSLQCSFKGTYSDLYVIVRKFEFNNVLDYHIFRQFTGPGVFRNVNHTTSLFISGLVKNLAQRAFMSFKGLRNLTISNTAIEHIKGATFHGLKHLVALAIKQNQYLADIYNGAFNPLKSLRMLSLRDNKLEILPNGLLDKLLALEWLDLKGNNIKLTSNIFKFNKNLTYIFSDTFVFCCDSIKPPSVTDENCVAPRDEISSCKNLIEDLALSILLWIFGILALFGNAAVCIYRFVTRHKQRNETFSIFVANLGLSDAIMGLYMLIIAIHDLSYKSKYVWKEYDWKNSALCTISGAIAYISSEASVMFISLITIDRFLAIKYPIGGIRISMKSAQILTLLSWIISIIMAVVPVSVYPMFYSYSGVCIGLPLSENAQQGWVYSASIVLGFNFLLFIFIMFGQIAIFWKIHQSSKRVRSSQTDREKAVAKMLLFVVLTDCFCWIPIGILVVVSLAGIKIPSVLYAWVVVVILPINSAINPFLYTFAPLILKMKKQKEREESLKLQPQVSNSSLIKRKNTETTNIW